VVWQFWGRAAEASWTEKFGALFCCLRAAVSADRPEFIVYSGLFALDEDILTNMVPDERPISHPAL
jgi:hypothetical protein